MEAEPIEDLQIAEVTEDDRETAVGLLAQFFAEEGFATPRYRIAANLDRMCADRACWVALARTGGQAVAVVTVTTMLYVEWGRLAEIGDLYVVPEHRRRGTARRLVAAAIGWSRVRGCSAAFVTITPEGEARHGLSRFYHRLAFRLTGRTTMSHAIAVPPAGV